MPSPRPALSAEFTAVYRDHADFVWRTLARRGVAVADLEDVTQEVFVVTHRRWGAWEGRASIRAWLFGVARHVATTYHRSESRQRRKLDALLPPSDEPLLDDRIDAQTRLDTLAAAITALDPERRDVFVLADIEGFSAPEIADALDCKLNTVYSRLRRARATVAAAMVEADDNEE